MRVWWMQGEVYVYDGRGTDAVGGSMLDATGIIKTGRGGIISNHS